MRFLVFQHHVLEHPGIFRDFMAEDGVEWDAVQLQDGETIPDLDNYDALWVMGGPMDVWEEDRYTWLIPEKVAIFDAVMKRNMPYLGLCLGHQLLGEVAGGKCDKMPEAEVGVMDISLTLHGAEDALLKGFDSVHKAVQWHGVEVSEAPVGSRILASTDACPVQALRVGDRAWGIQYHVEVTGDTVPEWGDIPAYREAVENVLGDGAMPGFIEQSDAHIDDFNRHARILYQNFMEIVRS